MTMTIAQKISNYFESLRHSKTNHLGLGDIRLTIGQQEELIEMLGHKRAEPYPDKVDLANAMKDVMRRRDARIRAEAYRNAIKIVTKHASPPHQFTGGLQIAQILDELGALADAEQEATR